MLKDADVVTPFPIGLAQTDVNFTTEFRNPNMLQDCFTTTPRNATHCELSAVYSIKAGDMHYRLPP